MNLHCLSEFKNEKNTVRNTIRGENERNAIVGPSFTYNKAASSSCGLLSLDAYEAFFDAFSFVWTPHRYCPIHRSLPCRRFNNLNINLDETAEGGKWIRGPVFVCEAERREASLKVFQKLLLQFCLYTLNTFQSNRITVHNLSSESWFDVV